MSNLDLLQAYLSTSPYPAVVYRPSTSHGGSSGRRIPDSHGYDLDERPFFANAAARTSLGDYPFAYCVAVSSQPSLKQGVEEAWQHYLEQIDRQQQQANQKDAAGSADKDPNPSSDRSSGASVRVEVTLLQAVSMIRNKQDRVNKAASPLSQLPLGSPRPKLSSSRPLSPRQDLSIRGEGNLQIIKWAFNVLPLSPSEPGPGAEGHILVLTGIWAQPGSVDLPDLHRARAVPVPQKGESGSSGSSASMQSSQVTQDPAEPHVPRTGHDESDAGPAIDQTLNPTTSSPASYIPETCGIPEQLERKAAEYNIPLPEPKSLTPSTYPEAVSPTRSPGNSEAELPAPKCAFPLEPMTTPTLASPGLRNNGQPLESYYSINDRPKDLPANLDPGVLARLAENAPIGMVIASTTAKLIWVNDMWYQLTGVKRGESLDSWIDRVAPEHMSLLLQTVGDLMETRAVANMDFMWSDGTWANFTTQCDYDEDGVFVGLIGTISDATRRKQAELNEIEGLVKREAEARTAAEEVEKRNRELAEANVKNQKLQQQRDMLASMAEISPTGLTIAKRDGTLVWVNKAFLAIHDLKETDKDNWAEVVHEDDLARLTDAWQESIRTGSPLRSRHRLKNGKTVTTDAILSGSNMLSGEAPYISSINDVTAEVEGERAMQRLSDQRVEEAEQRRKDAIHQKEQQALLVDCVSHELRNGINPILQSSLLIRHSLMLTESSFRLALQKDGFTTVSEANLRSIEEDIEACDAIIDSANQMERVANDILGLAQIQLNQLDVTPVPFDLGSQMRGIHRMFQADCKAKDLDLVLVLDNSLKMLGGKPMIKADPSRLQQIVVNLCSNAIKFTSLQAKREVTIKVEVNLQPPGEQAPIIPPVEPLRTPLPDGHPVWLYVSVSDTGPGMTPHELGKLFKKFTQANTEVHTQMGGNGLGLFIAKQLCELQGGRIEAVSTKEVPTGSVFRFFIRAASVVKPTEVSRSLSAPLQPVDGDQVGLMHILVVDDNEINRKTLARQLKMYKHKVKMAGDGQEALEIVEASEVAGTPFDCILLDVNLPVLDGLQCAAYLRKSEIEHRRSKPYWIVGCTGNARPEQIEKVLHAGMNTVITKPYRLPTLLKAIVPPDAIAKENVAPL